jgi:hypothetical protein
MSSLRITTTRSRDLQPLAVAGQTGIEAWRTLHTLLLRELSPAHAALLAEPVANEARSEVDWYAEGDGPAARLEDLPEPAHATTQARLDGLVRDVQGLAARLASSRANGDRFLSDMLALAMRLPGPECVHVLGEQPVLAGWGHIRGGERGGDVVLEGSALRSLVIPSPAAQVVILPPPASPYAVIPPSRTWRRGLVGASLLAPLLALLLLWADPFGWFLIAVPRCKLEPSQLALAQGLQQGIAREGVLRAELARLTIDAGRRRLMCGRDLPGDDISRAQGQGALGGKLQVILAWDDRNDLDLQIACPSGEEINFHHRESCGGTLDVDANGHAEQLTSSPIENVYFTDPPAGRYRVIVDPYSMGEHAETPFRLTIRRDGQADRTVTGTAQNGQRHQTVTEFAVDPP